MSLETVRADLAVRAPELKVIVTEASTATVQLAAEVHGCAPGQIAKTLCIRVKDQVVLLVTRGDARLDNKKTKEFFGGRPRMLAGEEVEALTSHKIGGVCPFGLPQEHGKALPIYCDVSLKVYDELIPAAGDTHSSVRLNLARLFELTGGKWADCCTVAD